MMGPLNNPGLIPRSFDVIFNSIGPHLGKKSVRSPVSLFSRQEFVSFGSSEWLRRSKWIGHSSRSRSAEEQQSSTNVGHDITLGSSIKRELFVRRLRHLRRDLQQLHLRSLRRRHSQQVRREKNLFDIDRRCSELLNRSNCETINAVVLTFAMSKRSKFVRVTKPLICSTRV